VPKSTNRGSGAVGSAVITLLSGAKDVSMVTLISCSCAGLQSLFNAISTGLFANICGLPIGGSVMAPELRWFSKKQTFLKHFRGFW
jgi:hypothetical protein